MNITFKTVEEAVTYIKGHLSGEDETDINGDVFFGLGPAAYTWSDVAEKAGITVDPVIPIPGTGGTVTNPAFHHFRNDDELRRVLELLQKEYHGLYLREEETA
ncbi:MAG: hypothetical protein IJ241_00305 [Clostridia bacterium]|nr:hypothetical protein [Clostridia bacterium]